LAETELDTKLRYGYQTISQQQPISCVLLLLLANIETFILAYLIQFSSFFPIFNQKKAKTLTADGVLMTKMSLKRNEQFRCFYSGRVKKW